MVKGFLIAETLAIITFLLASCFLLLASCFLLLPSIRYIRYRIRS
jgi:hypothetical protein